MTKGVDVQDVIASGDPEKLKAKLHGLLEHIEDGMDMPITIYCAQLVQAELQRQAVAQLEQSSNRLERLTKVLIWLTVVLMVLAAPPAIEIAGRLLGWLPH